MRIKILMILIIIVLLLAGCHGKPPANRQNQFQQKQVNNEKKIPVLVEKVQPRDLHQYIKITGKLEGITDITLSSEVSGKVIEIDKKLGDWIEEGEQIGRIDNKDHEIQMLQAEAALNSAEALFEAAELQMKTSEKLFRKEQISQVEFSQVKSNYKKAQAGLNGAKAGFIKAKRNFDNSNFVSPVAGFISELAIEIGETISMGKPVCSIVDSRKLLIKTGIGEKEVLFINEGQKVTIINDIEDMMFYGIVRGVGIKPVNNSASYPIEIEVDNSKGRLLPGMVVEARILSNVFKNVIYTSQNNIIKEYDNSFAFIINNEEKAERRKILLGEKIAENVIIQDGIKLDEMLVIEGAENLEDSSVVDVRKNLN